MDNHTKIIVRLDRLEKLLTASKEVLTFEEACEYAGFSRSFLYKLTSAGSIPHSKPNGKLIFFEKRKLNHTLPRICSFLGSTNMSSFLNDETGSVRWLCFELKGKIDFSYSKDININDVWSQAYHLAYSDPTFNPELSIQDIVENEERNKRYTKLTSEQEVIAKYYEKSTDMKDFKTATDVLVAMNCLNLRLNQINMGRALAGFGFQKVKHPKRQVYGYLAKSLFTDTPWEMELTEPE